LSGTAAEAKLLTTDLIAVHRSVSGRAASGRREPASARRFPAAPRIDLESRRRFRTSTRPSAAIGPMRSPRTSAHLAPILGGAGCTPTNSRAYGSEFSVFYRKNLGRTSGCVAQNWPAYVSEFSVSYWKSLERRSAMRRLIRLAVTAAVTAFLVCCLLPPKPASPQQPSTDRPHGGPTAPLNATNCMSHVPPPINGAVAA
jgi:hypothetical protein